MNNSLGFCFSLLALFSMQAQSTGSNEKNLKVFPPPVRELCSSGNACNDYFIDHGVGEQYIWSIRERSWVPTPRLLLFGFYAGLVSGPRVLLPGVAQEYFLACVSHYRGSPNALWIKEPAMVAPYKLGDVYVDDEVEIEWEIRTSPGLRIVTQPTFPSKLRYWEPLIASFKIEISGDSVQRMEIYANGYRDGKLIGYSLIPLIINNNGYSEFEAQREKKELQDLRHDFATKEHMDWHKAPLSERKIELMKREFESRHRLTKRFRVEGLKPGEFLTRTDGLKNR